MVLEVIMEKWVRVRPTKDEYFMQLALDVAQRSSDPKTQVGSVIVDVNDRVVSTGYNGTPRGFDECTIDWLDRDSIYPIVIHSEINAILYTGSRYEGSKLYVTLSPCKECIKVVSAAGIKKVIFKDKYKDYDIVKVLAERLNVQLVQFEGKLNGQEKTYV